jgi:hypothetical protein
MARRIDVSVRGRSRNVNAVWKAHRDYKKSLKSLAEKELSIRN